MFEDFTTAQATFGVESLNVGWDAQAVKKAESYLEIMAFSCQGLIDQLVFEKFTNAQATHGANQTGIC